MADIPLSEITRVFARIGVLSFGGPAAQIALMHRELVEERPWLTDAQFLRALSFCMLLPGPEAMQLATYAGWRMRGIPGGLIAGALFVLPGAAVILCLALLYLRFGDLPLVSAAFLGIKAAVVMIVIHAILRLSGKALKGAEAVGLAVLAFAGLFLFALPFPLIIGLAALWGAIRCTDPPRPVPPPDFSRSARPIVIGLALWLGPIGLLALAGADFFVDLGLFFSKLAVVTFGGAYAVLAYMTQEVVQTYGWVTTEQMIDAMGLAETTPGPLILVTQFVGHLAGAAEGGTGTAIAAGAFTLWVTFVPCFVWIFAGAPLIDWLEGQPRIAAALRAITAAVVGVIANLSVWFAAHVVFRTVGTAEIGPLVLLSPRWQSLDPAALALGALAAFLLFGLRWGLPATLLACSLVGLTLGTITAT